MPYAQDTLRFVAAEVRYPIADALADGVPEAFRERIHDTFPIQEPVTDIALSFGPAGPNAQQAVRQRFLQRDRLRSVTIGREAITFEATAYERWSTFREMVSAVLAALSDTQRPDGFSRVGLRYIDEIRVPEEVVAIADWAGWVDERLVAPLTIDDDQPSNATIALQFGAHPGYMTLFRAAPFAGGRTVQAEGPLRSPFATPDGAYFLLDTDAAWADPQSAVPEFDVGAITEIFNVLHAPCKRLFESSVGHRLRDEVLNRTRNEVWG